MQKELMEKGTITVAFTVFEDFELYSEGIYQHVKGNDFCVCVCVRVCECVCVCEKER